MVDASREAGKTLSAVSAAYATIPATAVYLRWIFLYVNLVMVFVGVICLRKINMVKITRIIRMLPIHKVYEAAQRSNCGLRTWWSSVPWQWAVSMRCGLRKTGVRELQSFRHATATNKNLRGPCQ